jgi:hypothetical protein
VAKGRIESGEEDWLRPHKPQPSKGWATEKQAAINLLVAAILCAQLSRSPNPKLNPLRNLTIELAI